MVVHDGIDVVIDWQLILSKNETPQNLSLEDVKCAFSYIPRFYEAYPLD